MNEKISESAYEIAVGSLQAQSKRLFIVWIITFVALIGTNAGWMWYESQFEETVTETIEASSDSGDAYGTLVTGENNEVTYGFKGESDTDKDAD